MPAISIERVVASAWWGFAEADRVILGVIVAVLAALATAYTVTRLVRTLGGRRRKKAATPSHPRRTEA